MCTISKLSSSIFIKFLILESKTAREEGTKAMRCSSIGNFSNISFFNLSIADTEKAAKYTSLVLPLILYFIDCGCPFI